MSGRRERILKRSGKVGKPLTVTQKWADGPSGST